MKTVRRAVESERIALALAIGSGMLHALARPAFDVWPLALVSSVPLLVAVRGRSPLRAFLLGLAQAFVGTELTAGGWLPPTLKSFVGVGAVPSVVLAALLLAWHAARMGLVMAVVARAERATASTIAIFPLAVVCAELFYPVVFPWSMAEQVSSVPLLCQAADIGGPVAVSAWLAVVSAALAEVASRFVSERRFAPGPLVVAAATLGCVCVYGAARIRAIDAAVRAAPEAHVAIVQPDVPHDGPHGTQKIVRALARTSELRRTPGVDLAVWPESVFSHLLLDHELAIWGARFAEHSPAAPVLVGAYTARSTDQSAARNSAVLFDGAGRPVAEYDKRKPLAFGEYVPLAERFPVLNRLLPRAGKTERGEKFVSFDVGGHKITPLICYEDVLPDFVNDGVAAGAPSLLVTITNDSWFGRTSAWRQHLAISRFRAIEHRRFLVRAANDAGSAVVDPVGRVDALPPNVAADMVASVRWIETTTTFERIGQLGFLGALVVLAAAFHAARLVSTARRGWRIRGSGRARGIVGRSRMSPHIFKRKRSIPMRRDVSFVMAAGVLGLVAACSQTAQKKESVGKTSQALNEAACRTVDIDPGGQGGGVGMPQPANFGVSSNKFAFNAAPCGPAVQYETPAGSTYAGDQSCPSQAILELNAATGSGVLFWVEPVNPPTDKTTCEATTLSGSLQLQDWSGNWSVATSDPSRGGTVQQPQGQWSDSTKSCSFWVEYVVGGDLSQFKKVRLVGSGAHETVVGKATTGTPIPVRLNAGRSCII